MIFEKGVRHSVPKPYEQGLEVPDTEHLILERGVLDTSKRKGFSGDFFLENNEKNLPLQIVLRARIQNIRFQNDVTKVRICRNSDLSELLLFYGHEILENDQKEHCITSQNSAVDLIFTGQAFVCDQGQMTPLRSEKMTLPFGENAVLYRKTFMMQSRSVLRQNFHQLDNGSWMIEPPYGKKSAINQLVLLPYGGYVTCDMALKNITQIFATIEPLRGLNRPRLILWTRDMLVSRNISMPLGGHMRDLLYTYTDDISQEDMLNMAGIIEKGGVRFKGSAIHEDEKPFEYASYHYVQNDTSTGCVDIYFQRL